MSDRKPNDAEDNQGKKRPMAKVVGEFVGLSPWKKKLLSLFLVFASIGGAMWVQATLTHKGKVSPPSIEINDDAGVSSDATPANARGMLADGTGRNAPVERTGDIEDEVGSESDSLPWHGRLGGWMARLGISFAAGLVVGVFFRTFLKTMAALTAIAVAAIAAASYFNVFDIDFATMRQNYDSAAGWAQGQVGGFKDLVVNFLPSATASGVGFVSGFLRK